MTGRVSLFELLPIMLMPIVAAGIYAGIITINPSEESIRFYVYHPLIGLQVIIGAAGFLWAAFKSFRHAPGTM